MKCWEIIGFVYNGMVLCKDCAVGLHFNSLEPIFADDENENHCERCKEKLGDG